MHILLKQLKVWENSLFLKAWCATVKIKKPKFQKYQCQGYQNLRIHSSCDEDSRKIKKREKSICRNSSHLVIYEPKAEENIHQYKSLDEIGNFEVLQLFYQKISKLTNFLEKVRQLGYFVIKKDLYWRILSCAFGT